MVNWALRTVQDNFKNTVTKFKSDNFDIIVKLFSIKDEGESPFQHTISWVSSQFPYVWFNLNNQYCRGIWRNSFLI